MRVCVFFSCTRTLTTFGLRFASVVVVESLVCVCARVFGQAVKHVFRRVFFGARERLYFFIVRVLGGTGGVGRKSEFRETKTSKHKGDGSFRLQVNNKSVHRRNVTPGSSGYRS